MYTLLRNAMQCFPDILLPLEELLVEVFAPEGTIACSSDDDDGDGGPVREHEMRHLYVSNNVCQLYTILAGMELVLQLTGISPVCFIGIGSLSVEQRGAVAQVCGLLPAVVAAIDRAGALKSLEPGKL
jgi:hypothetical protein